MSGPDNPHCRWDSDLTWLVDQVRGRHWKHQTLVNAIAARIDADPKHVSVEINEHLGRTYLRIEVAV